MRPSQRNHSYIYLYWESGPLFFFIRYRRTPLPLGMGI